MNTETIVYIIIALTAALLLALFQYLYKSKTSKPLRYWLALLRFITWFSVFLLLINPKFNTTSYYNEKPTLVVAVDNSESISYLKQAENAKRVVSMITNNKALQQRFNIKTYTFGKQLLEADSLDFTKKQTNISNAIAQLHSVYKNQVAPIVLLTDGNQTLGADYSYSNQTDSQPIYPVILGDSTSYLDLSVKQVNVNRYAFLKNKFPVEIILNYSGTETVNSTLKIWSGKTVVFKKAIKFDAKNTSEVVNTTLLANSVGVKSYKVELVPQQQERNTINNIKNFAVEVIDQKTNIALIYGVMHPDIGMLKKAIEANAQRKVTLLNSEKYISENNDYQLVILYQPNNKFKKVYSKLKANKQNTFTITGKATDWQFINGIETKFQQSITNQTEDFQPQLNSNFSTFIVNDLIFNNFPPLQTEFGDLKINIAHDVLLYKSVNGITTKSPLLATLEENNTKHAILCGEGIWRWRAQSYLEHQSFEKFDNFMGKLTQYLSSNKQRKRLNVDYNSFYNGNDNIIITAQYFNKNYEFDASASLILRLKNKVTNVSKELPMLLNNGNYVANLSGIEAGNYNFSIKNATQNIAFSGNFKVLEYNVEQQFLNANITKLKTLAEQRRGEAYFASKPQELFSNLLNDNRYKILQKSTKKTIPLVDYKYLLAIIALCLFAEWFIRKYQGLV